MARLSNAQLLIVIATISSLLSAKALIADDAAPASTSPDLFIDQRRLPNDGQKAQAPPPDDPQQRHDAEEQKKLDDLAAKLKAEEAALAAREAEAHAKFDELKRLSDEADVKRKEDEEHLREREAEAQRQVEEARRLAEEARRKLEEEVQKQSSQKETPPAAAPETSASPSSNLSASAAAALVCPDAGITASPLPGGRAKVEVQSPCRRTQTVSLRYGPIVTKQTFDDNGSAEFIADMFLGPGAETEVSFADGKHLPVDLPPGDVDQVTKVAIIWEAPVDLDLHAFEYAAVRGEPGDVWSGAPRAVDSAAELVTKDGRGHGFLSTVDDGARDGAKAEVFTLIHSKQQSRGVIAMALDYATRGDTPNGESCGSGKYAQIPIGIVVREAGGALDRRDGLIASAPCGKTLSADDRYRTGVIPDIRIHASH